jgi:hypothetical protein
VTSVEFAICGSALTLFYAAIIGLAALAWAETALQSVAADTARCVALGNTACSSAQQYAVSLAQQRIYAGAIATSDVAIATAASCPGATGQYAVVTITAHEWAAALTGPLLGQVVHAKACFPSHT